MVFAVKGHSVSIHQSKKNKNGRSFRQHVVGLVSVKRLCHRVVKGTLAEITALPFPLTVTEHAGWSKLVFSCSESASVSDL